MKSRFFAIAVLFLAAMAIPRRAKAPPPPMFDESSLPGQSSGAVKSYWLAPYVQVSEEGVTGHKTQTVTWYSEEGAVKKKVTGPGEIVHYGNPGYMVDTLEDGRQTTHGVNEPWTLVRAQKLGLFCPASVTPDSSTFIEPFNPEHGQIAVDVYAHGVLARTLGPFVQHRAESVEMNEDGSMAMLIWKDAAATTPQIVCADRNGAIRFRVDCDDADTMPIPAPDGVGALLNDMLERKNFTCYTREGKGRTVELSLNCRCIGWIPGTLRSLFETSTGHDRHYHLIDWDSGKEFWDIPCPGGLEALATTITPRLVIFAVVERYKGGPWRGLSFALRNGGEEIIRTFYAVRVEDGRFVARWQATHPSRFPGGGFERFVRLGKRLYFVAGDEFAELNEDDIIDGKKGWIPVADEK